jgi:hypothetical protein
MCGLTVGGYVAAGSTPLCTLLRHVLAVMFADQINASPWGIDTVDANFDLIA